MAYRAKVYRKPGGDTLVVASGGKIHVQAGGGIVGPNPRGCDDWFVNSGASASGDGTTWAEAFKTLAEAEAEWAAGDRVFIQGSFNEAVEVAVANLELIGVGPASHTALWTAPDTTAPCLTISAAANVGVYNVRFRPPVANAAISLEGASNQFQLIDCRIQGKAGSYYGLRTDGAQSNVRIERCEFFYLNTVDYGIAISGHTYAADITPSGWLILDNLFHSNLCHIVCRMRQSIIRGNMLAGKGLIADGNTDDITTGIDLSGTLTMCNLVQGNFLGGDYSTATYVAATDDNWIGNTSDDLAEAEVDSATGTTIAVPAA